MQLREKSQKAVVRAWVITKLKLWGYLYNTNLKWDMRICPNQDAHLLVYSSKCVRVVFQISNSLFRSYVILLCSAELYLYLYTIFFSFMLDVGIQHSKFHKIKSEETIQ